MPSRSRRERQARTCATEEPPEHPAGLPADFGHFGSALARDVVSAEFVRRRLDDALQALLESSALPPAYHAAVTGAAVTEARLVDHDDLEREFAVTVRVGLEADVGPRLLALGVEARAEVGLTVRVRAYHPATIGFDIDPVSPDDVWFRTRARTDWLPFPLLAAGPAGLSRPAQRNAERAVPRLCEMVNTAIDAAVEYRRFDLLDLIGRYSHRPPRSHFRAASRRSRTGRRVTFAELGRTLMHDGLDQRLVATALNAALVEPVEVVVSEPVAVRGLAEVRVVSVAGLTAPADERCFRVRLAADVEVVAGEGDRAAAVTGTVRGDVPLRVVPRVGPAMLVVRFDPLHRLSLRRVRRAIRGWMMPIPAANRALAGVRRKITEEVDRRLAETVVRVVAAELVDAVFAPQRPESFGVRVESGDGQSWPTAKPSSESRRE